MNDFMYKMNNKPKHWREVRELFVFPGAKNFDCFIPCLAHHESAYHNTKIKINLIFIPFFWHILPLCLCLPCC